MGEMADLDVDRMIESGMWGYGRRKSAYGPPVSCKHCGSKFAYWQNVKGKWQLHDKDSLDRHLCRTTEQRNAEGFDDVV